MKINLGKFKPLENRTHNYKKSIVDFFCPLCRAPRSLVNRPTMSKTNYIQVAIITIFFSLVLYPLIGLHSLFIFFPIWLMFEFFVRAIFRKEIPCPHCGFDTCWYHRDVKKARAIVEEFWRNKGPSRLKNTSEVTETS